MYTGLTGGVAFPALADADGRRRPAPTYAADIDNGIVTYDSKGGLHGIQWTSYLLGAQYYLPGVERQGLDLRQLLARQLGQYPLLRRRAAKLRAGRGLVRREPLRRSGPVGARRRRVRDFIDAYVDGQHAVNHRGQLSGFFIF